MMAYLLYSRKKSCFIMEDHSFNEFSFTTALCEAGMFCNKKYIKKIIKKNKHLDLVKVTHPQTFAMIMADMGEGYEFEFDKKYGKFKVL